MMHTLLYSEMSQAVVPGGPSSVSPGHDGATSFGECQVPSPSQWSDPCYSPPSFHSPQHLPVELEKVKEEPFSPPSSSSSSVGSPPYSLIHYHHHHHHHHLGVPSSSSSPPPPLNPHNSPSSNSPSPPSMSSSSIHGGSPYGRPASSTNGGGIGGGIVGHGIKKDSYENCINLSDLLMENQGLVHQHQANNNSPSSSPTSSSSSSPCPASPPFVGGGMGYADHPLLRGRLEDANSAFLKKISSSCSSGASPPPPPPSGSSSSSETSYFHHQQQQQQLLDDPSSSSSTYHHHDHHKNGMGSSSPSTNAVPNINGSFKEDTDEGLRFLESLVDVKRELEEDVSVGSSCGSPAVPSPGGQRSGDLTAASQITPQVVPCQRDILETVEILAQEHNRRDVQRVSDSLNIPRDPAQWSVEDVRAWLKLQAAQLNLPPLMLDFWNYGGQSLLKLTEQQFRQLAPIGGELLYAKLEIWREALKSSVKLSAASSQQSLAAAAAAAVSVDHHRHIFLQQSHHQIALTHHDPPMLLSAHHAHLQHHLQQQQQQQVVHASGGSSPSGASMGGSAPGSPSLPLVTSLSQVPTPVAQVSQQQQASTSPAPPSPQQQQGTSGVSAVYLDEPCLDMASLLQQQQQQPPPVTGSNSPSGSSPQGALNPPTHCSSSSQDDTYDSEEEAEEEICSTGGSGRGGTHIHLWQFLKELLQQPQLYGSCIRWLDRQKGVFKIEDSVRVARLWGKRKNRPAMNYDKLSRSIRQYYKKGIMKKTERSQRLVYQFCHPYSL